MRRLATYIPTSSIVVRFVLIPPELFFFPEIWLVEQALYMKSLQDSIRS